MCQLLFNRALGGWLTANTLKGIFFRLLHGLLVGQHLDGSPGAVFRAERTSDTSGQVYLNHLLELGVFHAGDDFDAVHGTKNNAGLTAGAPTLIDHGKFWR